MSPFVAEGVGTGATRTRAPWPSRPALGTHTDSLCVYQETSAEVLVAALLRIAGNDIMRMSITYTGTILVICMHSRLPSFVLLCRSAHRGLGV